jgi:hypothetical protein
LIERIERRDIIKEIDLIVNPRSSPHSFYFKTIIKNKNKKKREYTIANPMWSQLN